MRYIKPISKNCQKLQKYCHKNDSHETSDFQIPGEAERPSHIASSNKLLRHNQLTDLVVTYSID